MLDKVGHILTDASGNAFLDLRDFYRLLYTVVGDIAFKTGWLEMANRVEEEGIGKRNQVQLVCGAVRSMLQKKHQVSLFALEILMYLLPRSFFFKTVVEHGAFDFLCKEIIYCLSFDYSICCTIISFYDRPSIYPKNT
jgi:hypothetical protein